MHVIVEWPFMRLEKKLETKLFGLYSEGNFKFEERLLRGKSGIDNTGINTNYELLALKGRGDQGEGEDEEEGQDEIDFVDEKNKSFESADF